MARTERGDWVFLSKAQRTEEEDTRGVEEEGGQWRAWVSSCGVRQHSIFHV